MSTLASKKIQESAGSTHKWSILVLASLTVFFIVGIPSMGMSVLAKEISLDLDLDLVQVGVVWGIGALPAIFTSLLGGSVGDRFGPKRVLVIGVLLSGLLGAVRGLSVDFISMTIMMILIGALMPFVTMNCIKIVGQWFPPHQLALANGFVSVGFAAGFMVGALLSATTFSPLLGGWRNVLIAYGLIGTLFSIPWSLTPALPADHPSLQIPSLSMQAAIQHVARLRNVWLLGFTLFGIGGSIQGLLGYLPLHLRNLGWEPLHADGSLSAFHTMSMIFVVPIALWSDRLGSRKRLLMAAASMVVLGTGLLSIADGSLVWLGVLMVGFVRDAFMAIFLTMVIESDGVGPAYAGTAIGLTLAISAVANVLAPPLGNNLADQWKGAPFAFWAALALAGLICLSLVKNPDLIEEEEYE